MPAFTDGAKQRMAEAAAFRHENVCHEGNYALGGILRGARLLEDEAINGEAASTGGGSGSE